MITSEGAIWLFGVFNSAFKIEIFKFWESEFIALEIIESKNSLGGHIKSELVKNFTWDIGPHVSFTNNDFVKELFAKSVCNEYDEFEFKIINYSSGRWLSHPVQTNLYPLSENFKKKC